MYNQIVTYEWDPKKNQSNIRKHGVALADAVSVLEDEYSMTITDQVNDEERFVTLGLDSCAQILVVVYAYRGE